MSFPVSFLICFFRLLIAPVFASADRSPTERPADTTLLAVKWPAETLCQLLAAAARHPLSGALLIFVADLVDRSPASQSWLCPLTPDHPRYRKLCWSFYARRWTCYSSGFGSRILLRQQVDYQSNYRRLKVTVCRPGHRQAVHRLFMRRRSARRGLST